MTNTSRWRLDDGFEKKDLGVFMRELATQAENVQLEQEAMPKS